MSSVERFRKKPVVIEAMLFDGTIPSASAICQWANAGDAAAGHDDPTVNYVTHGDDGKAYDMVIWTLEGDMAASPGDWIIRGVQGEFYPCKPDIFATTYEPEDAAALREQPEARGVVDCNDGHADSCICLQPGDRECNCHKAYGFATADEMETADCEHDYRETADDRLPGSWIDVCRKCGHEKGTTLTAAQQPGQEGGGEVCPRCKGAGEYEGFARHASGDPQDEYAATVQCEPCEGTGEVAAPPSAPVGVEGITRYSHELVGNYTYWNVRAHEDPQGQWCRYTDVWQASLTQQPAQAAPGDDTRRLDWIESQVREYGDGYTEPFEASVVVQWQQQKPNERWPGLRAWVDEEMARTDDWLDDTPPGDDAAGGGHG